MSFYADLVEQAEAGLEPEDGGWELRPPPSDGYEEDRARTLAAYLELKVAGHRDVLEWRRACWGSTRPVDTDEAPKLVEDNGLWGIMSGREYLRTMDPQPVGNIKFFGSDQRVIHHVRFYKGSHLEGLRNLSEELRTELFPLWTQAEAAWIIVTGRVREVPRCLVAGVDSFFSQHLTYGTINLRVEPWITGETVLRTYQYLQALALPRRPRALSERNLAMTRWVMERLRDIVTEEPEDEARPSRVSWHRLMAWWNEEHPEWAFHDERNFFRDCQRTIRAVARPYNARWWAESPKVTIP